MRLPIFVLLIIGSLLTVSAQHRPVINQIVLSGDGHRLAVTYFYMPSTIDIFDTSTGDLLETIDISPYTQDKIALSPQGDKLLWTSSSGEIYIYYNGEILELSGPGTMGSIRNVIWNPVDPYLIAWITTGHATFLNLNEEQSSATIVPELGGLTHLTFSPDGRFVATSHLLNTTSDNPETALLLWNLPESGEIQQEPIIQVDRIGGRDIKWHPNGEQIAVVGLNGFSVFDVTKNETIVDQIGSDFHINSLAFSPDGRYLATSGDFIHLWDAADFSLIGALTDTPAIELAWSPDSRTIYSMDIPNGGLAQVDVTELVSNDLPLVAQIAQSGDLQIIAVRYYGSDHPFIDFFDANNGELIQSFDISEYAISHIALSPHGDRLVFSDINSALFLYDVQSEEFTQISNKLSYDSIQGLYWSPTDSSLIAYPYGGSVNFYNVDTQEKIGFIPSTLGNVSYIAFNDLGTQIASSHYVSADRIGIEIWNIPTTENPRGTPIATIPNIGGRRLTWSPNGEQVAAISATGYSVYNVATGDLEGINIGINENDIFNDIAFSPDGNYLATGGDYIRIWDTNNFTLLESLIGTFAIDLAWSPDGHTIYSDAHEGGLAQVDVTELVSKDLPLVAQIAQSSDLQTIAVAYFTDDERHPIDFFNTATGELIHQMDTSIYGFGDFAISPNGDRLIGTDSAGGLVLYDTRDQSFTILREPGQFASLGGLYWSPTDESLVAYILGGSVNFLNVETNRYVGSIISSIGNIGDVAINGNEVATSSFIHANIINPDTTFGVEIWQLPSDEVVIDEPLVTLNNFGGGNLDWSADGEKLAVLGADGLSVYDMNTSEIIHFDEEIESDIYNLAWSSNGQYIATNGNFLRLWDTSDYTLIGEFSITPIMRELAWSPDGTTIFAQNLLQGGLAIFNIQ